MFAEQIEKMKRQYTDKYVVVDATRPELARFRDVVGRVKTVNMSGRALVEFDDYHLNIGWYDIDPDFLKVVDKPPPKAPKPEVKKSAPKGQVEVKPQAKAVPTAAGKAGKPSVADILAAARAGKAAAPAKTQAEKAPVQKQEPSEEPPAPTPPTGEVAAATGKPKRVDKSNMSIDDILAYCRQHDAK